MKGWTLFARWLLANLLGFVIGSLLGASNGSLIVALLSGRPALVLGDLVFGAAIGAAQWLALRNAGPRSVPLQWILATSIGFMVGARSGARFGPELVDAVGTPPSVAFGIIMGASIGLATTWVLRHRLRSTLGVAWTTINVIAWAFGESIAFSLNFSQRSVAFVAVAIASVSWLAIELLPRSRSGP